MYNVKDIIDTLYDKGDYCLRTSLWYTTNALVEGFNTVNGSVLSEMVKECRITSIYPIKSDEYKWSNSGSANDSENTWLKRPTYKIYKTFGVDLHKGLNADQFRAYFTALYARYKYGSKYVSQTALNDARKIWKNFKKRGFMHSSLMENALLKPHSLLLLLEIVKNDSFFNKIMYKVSKTAFEVSMKRNLKQPVRDEIIDGKLVEGGTTNKITLLITMKLLGLKLPDIEYIEEVYGIYFAHGEVGKLVRESCINYFKLR